MENFDILMEGTILGSQIDMVILEESSTTKSNPILNKLQRKLRSLERKREKYITYTNRGKNKYTVKRENVKSFLKLTKEIVLVKAEIERIKAESEVLKSVKYNQSDSSQTIEAKAKKAIEKVIDETQKREKGVIEENLKEVPEEIKKETKKSETFWNKVRVVALNVWEKIKKLYSKLTLSEIKSKVIKNAARFGLIVAAYSVAYGIFKTIKGVSIGSFTAVKTNLKTFFTTPVTRDATGAKIVIARLIILALIPTNTFEIANDLFQYIKGQMK